MVCRVLQTLSSGIAFAHTPEVGEDHGVKPKIIDCFYTDTKGEKLDNLLPGWVILELKS